MSSVTLGLDAALTAATALLFAYAARLALRRRPADPEAARAGTMFGVWWLGLSAVTALGVVRVLLALGGNLDPAAHDLLTDLALVPFVVMLWGLVYYLSYIYSGNARLFWPLGLAHAALLAYLYVVTSSRAPTYVEVADWAVTVKYSTELPPLTTATLVGVILLPTLAAAVGYASLYWKTDDAEARYRIAMISGAFIAWFGSAGVGALTPLHDQPWWPVASRLVSLGATLMVIAAYNPPRRLRRRAGEGEPSAGPGLVTKLSVLALRQRAARPRVP